MRRLFAAIFLVMSVIVAAPSAAAAAEIGEGIELPFSTMFDFLVDVENEQIYMTQGWLSHDVYVMDLDGQEVGTIGGFLDPSGMALSEDSATLYVALPQSRSVATIDPTTLQVTGSIDMPQGFCPGSLAVSGQYLIVGLDCDRWGFQESDVEGLAVIDTSGGVWINFGRDFDAPRVVAATDAPGTIVVYDENYWISVYDVTQPAPTELAFNTQYMITDGVLLPDGTKLIVAATLEQDAVSLDMPLLTPSSTYSTPTHQDAVAVSPDGLIVATASDSSEAPQGLRLHNVNKRKAIRRYPIEGFMLWGGLGVDATADRVYAVTYVPDSNPRLFIFPGVGWPECDGKTPTIVGTTSDDTIVGTATDDVILGLGGADTIYGLDGNDTVCAGGGNDILIGGPGDDTLLGGTGLDTVSYESLSGPIVADLLAGIASGDGEDRIKVENIIGSSGDDDLRGTDGPNVIAGGAGNDFIRGRKGADTLTGSGGDDEIEGNKGPDSIDGGEGDDVLSGHTGADGIHGGEGYDSLDGGPGSDQLYGDTEGDSLNGRSGDDALFGGDDGDLMIGGTGNDDLRGGSGGDLLLGGAGDDALSGQAGNDTLAGEADDDVLDGGSGTDAASFAAAPSGVQASIASGVATGEGSDSMTDIEWLVGSEHADILIGDSGENLLDARGGDDDLTGSSGDDFLQGGDGFDILKAGKGDDLCAEGEDISSCELIIGLDQDQSPTAWFSHYLPRAAGLLGIETFAGFRF